MGKTIVITGGSGYVGSRVAEALAAKGEKVIAVDIVSPKERGISFSPNIEFRQHDLRIPAEAIEGLKGADIVLHLAADIGSLTYMHDHQAEILTNNSQIDAAVYPPFWHIRFHTSCTLQARWYFSILRSFLTLKKIF